MTKWKMSEVQSYLEQLILDNEATEDEIEMYEDMIWSNTYKLNKRKYFNTYIMLVQDMNDTYNN